jgi:hypothetical protein
MNIFDLRQQLIDDYSSYIRSFIQIRDPRIYEYVDQELFQKGVLWPEPLIQLNPLFEAGKAIDELVEEGVLHPACRSLFRRGKDEQYPAGWPLRLHKHQEEAIRLARDEHSYVLTTGTGSSKSLSYLIPIVDYVLRHPRRSGILERACARDESIFDHYPFLIISTDFIKADRRRDQFLQSCPELVIIDEAHTCAYPGEGRSARHQRYQLVAQLAMQTDRHIILVTATPHSGNEQAFRSLLTFLNEEFKDLPEDLSGRQNERQRQRLAAHFVQRKRVDLRSYLHQETPFPERLENETHYTLTTEYRKLVDEALDYARKTVTDTSGGSSRQRVRWWSVLALLRSLASSPAAATFTLRNRAQVAGAETVEEADSIGRHTVLDLTDNDATEGMDVAPGSEFEDEDEVGAQELHEYLAGMAKDAEALREAHRRVRRAASMSVRVTVEPQLPPDVLGMYVYLPYQG